LPFSFIIAVASILAPDIAAGLAGGWLSEGSVNLDGTLQKSLKSHDPPQTLANG
jgi:hypothetical protein